MEIITFIALIVLIFMFGALRRRVRVLEVTVRSLNERTLAPDAKTEPPAADIEPVPAARSFEPSDYDSISPAATEAEPIAAASPQPARDYGDLERRFGTQWVIWVGGIALALGGIFLVRYSIEAGLFGPGARILSGAALAALLVGAGEVTRRRAAFPGFAQIGSADIPSILTAAGTTVAYADIYAAYALYDFLSPETAFILLGLIALVTLAAALVHGPALAGLGLVGAYVTPALVASTQPNYWALYVYLAIVTAAAYALARVRHWRWLALTAAAFSFLWVFPGTTDPDALAAHVFHLLAGFVLASMLIVTGLAYGPSPERGRFDLTSVAVLTASLLGAFVLVLASRHEAVAVITLFALCAATAAIAWRSDAAVPGVAAAALVATLVTAHWSVSDDFVSWHLPGGPLSSIPAVLKLEGLRLHLVFGAAIAVLFGAAGYLAQGRAVHPYAAIIWAAAGALTPLAILFALYYGVAGFERSIPFAGLALLLAASYGTAAETLNRRTLAPGGAAATAIFACGALIALVLALTFTLERGWLTVSFALMVPGVAYIADKRPLPLLRQLCILLVLLVMARIAIDPRIVGDDVGETPIFNWLLWGYGVPALSFWLAGIVLRRRGDDLASRSVDSAAIVFTALTAMLEIRHLMNDGDIYSERAGLAEAGLQVSTGLAMTIGLEHIRARTGSIVHDVGARIIGGVTFIGILIVVFGAHMNPILSGDGVGGTFLNTIMLGYGIPALLAAILARKIRDTRPAWLYRTAAVTAIALALVYLSLEVRTIFHGPVLTGPTGDAEQYTYSAVWLAFGVALLLVGISLQSQPARFASAAVVILTVAKVFLYDLAGVQGVFRALSFICLGLVLIGIGWLYQRLLFSPRPADAAKDAG